MRRARDTTRSQGLRTEGPAQRLSISVLFLKALLPAGNTFHCLYLKYWPEHNEVNTWGRRAPCILTHTH